MAKKKSRLQALRDEMLSDRVDDDDAGLERSSYRLMDQEELEGRVRARQNWLDAEPERDRRIVWSLCVQSYS